MLASRPVAKQLFKALEKESTGGGFLQPNEQAAAAAAVGEAAGGAVATVALLSEKLKKARPIKC